MLFFQVQICSSTVAQETSPDDCHKIVLSLHSSLTTARMSLLTVKKLKLTGGKESSYQVFPDSFKIEPRIQIVFRGKDEVRNYRRDYAFQRYTSDYRDERSRY